MLTSYSNIDYRTTHFEYKDLHRIHGQPDIDALLRMFRQLKRNAQRVPTTLGGGQLGYLALVLSTVAFNSIPNSAPFVRPLPQGAFTPSNNRLTAAELALEKSAHDENVRVYNECQAVEQALRNQIIDAIPAEYLDSLRNADTDMINCSIPDLITFLQTNYCRITDQELSDKEDILKKTIFDPTLPVDLIFNKIKLHADLCIMTNKPKPDHQLVQLGYLIFNRCRAYMDALKTWNAKADVDRTYANFMIHMRTEFHALRQVGALTIQDSSLNMIRDLTTTMNQRSDELNEQLNATMKANFMEAYKVINENRVDANTPPPPTAQALAMQSPNAEMMTMIAAMQTKMDALTARLASTNVSTSPTMHGAAEATINPRT